MADAWLRLIVRTPRGSVYDGPVTSLRVPTDTGHVGLRPRAETTALVVEPGLVLAATDAGLCFAATAGGLLRCDGTQATLLTPIAVVGSSAAAVRAELDAALQAPSLDRELRTVLQRLETGLLHELRRDPAPAASGEPHA